MNREEPIDDIPPAPPLSPVAHGTSDHGERWTIEVGGTRDNCYTFMNIELPDGRQAGGGGMGGPVLPAGGFMNCSVHWSDRSGVSVSYVVGRVHPAVRRLYLEFAGDAPGIDLEPVGESAQLGVAFVAAILPRSADLIGMSAWDEQGERLEQQRTTQYREMLQTGRRGPESADLGTSEHSDWRPLNGI
jgi:hypothetical protein